MASQVAVLDLEVLLEPIGGENPSGESFQYQGLHDEIREARRADDDLNQGEWKRELKTADFDRVIQLAGEALRAKTKDLQVAAWLVEAVTVERGFAGCRDGLRLVCGLHEKYWDTFYPEIDEGDLEARSNVLSFMDRQVADALKKVPLTLSPGLNFSYIQWEESRPFDVPDGPGVGVDAETQGRLADLRAKALEEGKTSGEEFRKAKGGTRRPFYEETHALLAEAWEAFVKLDRQMDERFGRQTPGLGLVKKSLEEIRPVVEKILKEKRILEPDPAEAMAPPEAGDPSPAASPTASTGPVSSRQEALVRLAEVADYFRRTEPHSPVSYLVQRAVSWGHMPLDTWLAEVIKDGGVLDNLRETLGIKKQ